MHSAEQLIRDILDDYSDELSKEACDDCDSCGPVAMCSFHSVLSALQGNVWTNAAISRNETPFKVKLG